MVIDTSKVNFGSWKTTLGGFVSGGLLFISSYLSNGHTINIHDPKFWGAFVVAAWGYVQKDSGVTGGTKLASGSVPDATLHQEVQQPSSPNTSVLPLA
jgi:hypothetical protein